MHGLDMSPWEQCRAPVCLVSGCPLAAEELTQDVLCHWCLKTCTVRAISRLSKHHHRRKKLQLFGGGIIVEHAEGDRSCER